MVCSSAMGQLSNNSPISYYGLGDVSSSALSSDISLGGASTANYSSYMINNLNPSSYSALYTQLADASFVSKQKRITLGRAYSSQGFDPRLHSLPDNVSIAWCGDHRGDNQGISEQLNDIYKSIS